MLTKGRNNARSDGSDAKERLLLGTADGEVVMLEGTDARSMFSTDNSLPVVSIVCYSKVGLSEWQWR